MHIDNGVLLLPAGIYEICFDNRIGAGHTKLIDVFMNIYKMEEWQGDSLTAYYVDSAKLSLTIV